MINIDADVSQPTVRCSAFIQGKKTEKQREREIERGERRKGGEGL